MTLADLQGGPHGRTPPGSLVRSGNSSMVQWAGRMGGRLGARRLTRMPWPATSRAAHRVKARTPPPTPAWRPHRRLASWSAPASTEHVWKKAPPWHAATIWRSGHSGGAERPVSVDIRTRIHCSSVIFQPECAAEPRVVDADVDATNWRTSGYQRLNLSLVGDVARTRDHTRSPALRQLALVAEDGAVAIADDHEGALSGTAPARPPSRCGTSGRGDHPSPCASSHAGGGTGPAEPAEPPVERPPGITAWPGVGRPSAR